MDIFLFYRLILAHVVGDYLLQFDWLYAFKVKSHRGIALHCIIVALAGIILSYPYAGHPLMWAYYALLYISHFFMDIGKFQLINKAGWQNKDAFLFDQFMHILWVVIVSVLVPITLSPIVIVQDMNVIEKIYYSNTAILILIGIILFFYRGIILMQFRDTTLGKD